MAEVKEKKVVSSGALTPADFVHLHCHTHYSLLDGMTKVPNLVDYVKETGMEAVAVTDHGTMSGLIELYTCAKDAGIKPILGLEAYVAMRKMGDRDPAHDKKQYHITLLAMNNVGYENLCRLMTESEINGKYYKPRIDHEVMEKYSEGVICLSGCAASEISKAVRDDDFKKAEELLKWHHELYGDRFYLEMQDHGHPDSPSHWPEQQKINEWLQKKSVETGIPLTVTADAHYLRLENQDAHDVLICVGTGRNLSETNRMSLKEFELNVVPPEEIIARWGKDFPEAVRNTRKIADMCDVDLHLGQILIPKFPCPKGETEKSYLEKLVFRGLAERYGVLSREKASSASVAEIRKLLSAEVLERIDYELSIVENMGYFGYFLIVQDFVNWGKDQGIVFGPGRGSAAGSLLAYAVRITDLNPLDYGLLFERFLNPDRISMPDIDIDIQDTRRDEVIEYCANKYGQGRVANIVTFGKMMAKNAVRDVARVLEIPYTEADRVAKLVPDPIMGRHVKLREAIVDDPDLKTEYETNLKSKEVIDYAMQLEGTIRNHGVHACGVIIAPDDLVKYLPLEVSAKGPIASQYPMGDVENIGLLKMDFLGLSNLSVINGALRIIKKVYGVDIDISSLTLDDDKTYELFRKGDTTGVFQFESAGMKRYLRELQPTRFEDIVAMSALYRPGPMEFIPQFVARKNGKEAVTYLHPGLESSLKDTYGVMVYQEQFMKISKEWCGFTGGQADTLRKAVGKKKKDLMMQVKKDFVEGAMKVGGASEEIAETFWHQLEAFADYCFNKSHAACYSMVAYWTAYLKAHYPDAFMAALMTSDMRWTDRLAIEISEAKHQGIEVLGPDINESYADFAIVGKEKKIRFGLAGTKGMGRAIVEELIEERERNGKFTSVCDFAKRVNATKFSKKSWEAAIKTGAFDSFADRSDLLFNLEKIQAYGAKIQKEAASGQADLFGLLSSEDADSIAIPEVEIAMAPSKFSEKEMLGWERELMGIYISAHPLDSCATYFDEQVMPFTSIKPELDGASVIVGGLIVDVRTILTKSGSKMAFVKLEDKTDEIEVIVFPKIYEQVGAKIVQDAIVKVSGRVNAKDSAGNKTDEVKVIADQFEVVTEEDLKNYESTGGKAKVPARGVPQKQWPKKGGPVPSGGGERIATSKVSDSLTEDRPLVPKTLRKLYVLIKNPEDTGVLQKIRGVCEDNSGMEEIILILGEKEKKAMRLPFRVEISEILETELGKIVEEGCIKVK